MYVLESAPFVPGDVNAGLMKEIKDCGIRIVILVAGMAIPSRADWPDINMALLCLWPKGRAQIFASQELKTQGLSHTKLLLKVSRVKVLESVMPLTASI